MLSSAISRSSTSRVAVAFLCMTAAVALAQTTGGGSTGSGSTGGSTGSSGRTPTTPTAPTNPSTTNNRTTTLGDQAPMMRRPLFFSGKVTLEDGTPPPEPVPIDFTCGGRQRREAFTDTKGRFQFELGRNAGVLSDASMSGPGEMTGSGMASRSGMGGTSGSGGLGGIDNAPNVMGCELRASLPGFYPATVTLGQRRSMDNPDIGILILKRVANVEGLTISATSGLAPKDARKAYEKALNLVKKNKVEEAETELRKAVEIYPKYAVAWNDLGRLCDQEKKTAEAKEAFQKSIAADNKFINPYRGLTILAIREQKWQEVADLSSRVIHLNPNDFLDAYFFNAVANYNVQKPDLAEKSAKEAARLDTEHKIPKINHLLGTIQAGHNDLKAAAENFSVYLQYAPQAPDADTVRKQLDGIRRQLGTQTEASVPAAAEQPKPEKQQD
jgi:tetratricopeptide (TPR) repeat protein